MKSFKASWVLALILSVSVFAASAQAAVGKSGFGKSPRAKQAATLDVGQKKAACDQNSDQRAVNYRSAGLKHKFGIRR